MAGAAQKDNGSREILMIVAFMNSPADKLALGKQDT